MNTLRRAIGRKEVVLGLVLFLMAGGWYGWHLLTQPAVAQVASPSDAATQVRALLDVGQFTQAVLQADGFLAVTPTSSALLKYKAVAQLLDGDAAGATQTADGAALSGVTGPDAAVLLAVKALVLCDYEHRQPAAAHQIALAALQQAGSDPEAGLLAGLACAAALRGELGPSTRPSNLLQQAGQIRQVLEPLYPAGSAEPQSVWLSRLWRRGLVTLADCGFLATEAGDPTGEAASLALLQRLCPQDVWTCFFGIPDKALQIARTIRPAAVPIDDHARAAMLTAAGFLYVTAGERVHGDALLRKAVQAYGRLLEDYDGWDGEIKDTVTPRGQFKKVGSEFYTYRNRMERLAKYCAEWWGVRTVRQDVDLPTALAQCDHKLFRAIVRVRADRQTDPIVILQQERVREADYATVAGALLASPYAPQADWERERTQLITRIGREEVNALDIIDHVRELLRDDLYDEALGLLGQSLQTEPALAETGVTLRCEAVWVLIAEKRYEEALGLLDDADQILQTGDERLVFRNTGGLRGRIGYYRMRCARAMKNYPQAIQAAEQTAGDSGVSLSLRGLMLLSLVDIHIEVADQAKALDAYGRLARLSVTPAQSQAFHQAQLRVAQAHLAKKGWNMASPASQPTTNG